MVFGLLLTTARYKRPGPSPSILCKINKMTKMTKTHNMPKRTNKPNTPDRPTGPNTKRPPRPSKRSNRCGRTTLEGLFARMNIDPGTSNQGLLDKLELGLPMRETGTPSGRLFAGFDQSLLDRLKLGLPTRESGTSSAHSMTSSTPFGFSLLTFEQAITIGGISPGFMGSVIHAPRPQPRYRNIRDPRELSE